MRRKENEKDVKKRYKTKLDYLNDVMTEGNITYVYMLDILWIVITLIRLRKRSTRNNFKI